MKRLHLVFLTIMLFNLFIMSANSQNVIKNYEAEWAKVESSVKKGLPQSALAEVKKIYTLAKRENQDAQVIKSLAYRTGLQQENRENNEIAAIIEIETEIAGAKEPVTFILKSLLAELYWNYFQNNRWQFYDRTNTINFNKEDITTWTVDDLHKKTSTLYLASVKGKELLQQTKLEPFDAIIVKGNVRNLRPTLYDLLARRALNYFKNDEKDITNPAYVFEINQAEAFATTIDFVNKKFTTNDSLSLHHKAIELFQDLLGFHLQQKNIDALIDADIERIQFVHQYSVHPDKENLYLTALTSITKNYPNYPTIDQAWYLIAQHYENKATQYRPRGDTIHRYTRIEAKKICEKILSKNVSDSPRLGTEGKINCYNLLNQINRRELRFTVEKVNVPGQAFRSLVHYKNFNALYLRIIKLDKKLKTQIENNYDEKYWNDLIATIPLKTWQQDLPATNDIQTHSTEIRIDPLPAGEYILLAGTERDFENKKTTLGAKNFYVSSISYVGNGADFFVLNRNSGLPLANASVQLWEQRYDGNVSKYIKEKKELYKTGSTGFFNVRKNKTTNRNYNYLLEITHGNETLFMNDWLYDYYHERNTSGNREATITWLFTDRGIYRPGQTIYFKGIVTEKKNNSDKATVRTNYITKIFLHDANNEIVDSLKVKTNTFGSFSGKFQLPQGLLNGSFSLQMANEEGHSNIQVEEYKRPKFFVAYEKIKGSYNVNDSIKITGNARAYAGNSIDNAIVKYRVVREPRFLYPWLIHKWWLPPTQQMEIAHGEVKTDPDGKFNISFKATPDLTIDKKIDPVFDYKIYADVTDINGETRNGELIVSVSYKSLLLKTETPGSLPVDSLHSIFIRTENMSGTFESALIKITISKLKEEKRLIRNRFWERPDQFVMSKNEYIRNFPNDEYDNETNAMSWEKGQRIYEKKDTAKENGKWLISNVKTSAGFYLIEISTTDKEGNEIKVEKILELFDEKNKQLNRPQYLWSETGKTIEPEEKTSIKLGTAADNLFIIQETSKRSVGKKTAYEIVNLNNEKKSFDFSATESDRGGYGLNYFFVKHNRIYQTFHLINVPWNNKELKIEYATFRDKTLPGSHEKWNLKIIGYKNEKIAAEMLASMYDASLDQFYPFEWNKPQLWPYYYNSSRWNGVQNFAQAPSNQKWMKEDQKYFKKEYDYLSLTLNERMQLSKFSSPGIMRNYGIKSEEVALDSAAPQVKEALSGRSVGTAITENKTTSDKEDATAATLRAKQELLQYKANSPIQVRKNFNETVFFFPELQTDSSGAIEFSFTMPEALTKWKFQTLAHTNDLAIGLASKELVTQKQVMVQPNAPRFLREGDKLKFITKIVNLTDKEATGQAELQLFDPTTNQSVDGWFQNMSPIQYFTVAAGQSEAVQFPIEVPYLYNKALTWRVVAKTKDVSDGEESSIPVLTNKILVTETLPLNMGKSNATNFTFEKLLHAGESETLQHHALTLEYTSNPAWYAVQALPYLMEYPYECAEQTWNRYYANSLATMIVNSAPRLKQIFEQWKTKDSAALLSNLQQNQELKSILLEETPWVLHAKTEEQQKKNISLLFDMTKMNNELGGSLKKLKQMQLENGGFVWFNGGEDDRYITQYIVAGIGHLKKLKGLIKDHEEEINAILAHAIPYLDKKIRGDYDNLIKHKNELKKHSPSNITIQYLYMRSFFPEYKIPTPSQVAYNYYKERAQQTWTNQSKYIQAMLALILHRAGDSKTSSTILKSLKETAVVNEELGMYYKNQWHGWFWYEAPIETQALVIEAFSEASKDAKTVANLKTWLFKNKQTNNWKTTKATAEACYALLLQGTNWLSDESIVSISLGNTLVKSTDEKQEAGTGYFKKTIAGEMINADMGNIRVSLAHNSLLNKEANNSASSWGAVYWQYFENLDKITAATTPLVLTKKLFKEMNTDRGPVLKPLNEGSSLKVGDKIKVRIELRVDRDMEYVHMKDMRASTLEPVNVISSHKWQGGLGYYETTKDASTNFFFSDLLKGTYVFEYALFATHKGNFSNGLTSIQCMYAPEFISHSEGIRLTIE